MSAFLRFGKDVRRAKWGHESTLLLVSNLDPNCRGADAVAALVLPEEDFQPRGST